MATATDRTQTTPDPPNPWLTLTPRDIELVLWQLVMDMGGEVSIIEADDKPGRSVMFAAYDGELVVIANEE